MVPEDKKTICDSCPTGINKCFLMSVRKDERWSLVLCPKTIKEKLLSVNLEPHEIEEAFKRFADSLANYPVCKHGADSELKPC